MAKLKQIHLAQYEEIYQKTYNRLGKLLDKHRRTPKEKRNPRKEALELIDTAYNIIKSKLQSYKLFYKIVIGNEELKRYLFIVLGEESEKKLKQAAYLDNKLANLYRTIRKQLFYQGTRFQKNDALSGAARLLSLIKRKRKLLESIVEIKKELLKAPIITGVPPIVIIGPPNAGKTTLAQRISKTKSATGDYPFTTKEVIPGKAKIGYSFINITLLDTPGLLYRSKRNIIEKRALATIRIPDSIVIFIFDPDPSSPTSIEEQFSLLNEVEGMNPNVILVINKIDIWNERAKKIYDMLKKERKKAFLISALKGEGIDELVRVLNEKYRQIIDTILSKHKKMIEETKPQAS